MTCLKHTRALCLRRALLCTLLSCAAASAGCADDPPKVSLELLNPAQDATLTMDDDRDPDRTGLQLDVLGESRGLGQGTTVEVMIDGEKLEQSGKVDADGDVAIKGATLPPGTHDIQLRTATGSAESEARSYAFKAMMILAPKDRAELTGIDDLDPGAAGVQVDVKVGTFALGLGDDVALLVDDAVAATSNPDANGEVVFAAVTLSDGDHTLQAVTGEGESHVESEPIEVEVKGACAELNFLAPAPPDSGALVLGGDGTCPGGDDPFEIDVRISTDAGNGRPITLFVNGQQAASGEVDGSAASFEGVTLGRRDSANTLSVEVENKDGVTCRISYPVEILVDCAGPDCSIDGPSPLAVTEDGKLTSYLNASMRGSGGFAVVVGTSGDAVGERVSLIIDGRVRDALGEDAQADGGAGRAVFAGVDLDEGEHTIEAQCRDGAGNVTSSGEISWTVDTQPCGVTLTDPAAGTLFIEADDEIGAGPAADVQVVATATISGSDCTGQRAAVCDPAVGISADGFGGYDGSSPLLSTVTLDPGSLAQSLCVEIEDRAGNVGRGDVAVLYRDSGDAPALVIESPASGARYSALGGGVYAADANAADTACQADFVIACSEVGVDVDLYHAGQSSPFGIVPCEADSAAPSGYAGRARGQFAFSDGDQSADIVARQEVPASSGELLVGSSAEITVEGDCRPPSLFFIGDPCREFGSGQLDLITAGDMDIELQDATSDIVSASLRITEAGSAVQNLSPTTSSSASVTFAAVDLGGVGEVTIEGTLVDDFGNTAVDSCTVEVVDDLPSIDSFTQPADLAAFGPGESCDTGTPGQYGVRVVADLDTDVNRDVTILVQGVSVASSVPVAAGGGIDICVPVPVDTSKGSPGPSVLTLLVDSDVGPGQASATRTVSVSSIEINDPTDDQVLTSADNCAGAGFGSTVQFTVDIIHDGGTVDLTTSQGGSLNDIPVSVTSGRSVTIDSACLTIADDISEEGTNTITATVDTTTISDSVDVVIVNQVPTTGITLVSTAAALDDVDHRLGALTTWTAPTMDWPGQLVRYELRCRRVALDSGETDPTKEQWWDDVIDVDGRAPETLPAELTPDDADPSYRLGYRPLQPRHCVLRAFDGDDQATPIVGSTDLTLRLRQQVIAVGAAAGSLGYAVTAVGDLDGDSIDDILVGGQGEAALIWGTDTGFSGSQDVSFTNSGSVAAGRSVVGLGDFDGDGLDDFAIGDHDYNSTQGRTIIFYGRARADWPASINMEASPCPGDLCIEHTGAFARSARALASAGNFDADGQRDLVIGAPWENGFGGQALVVLADAYHRRTCASDTDCRASEETCAIDAGAGGGSQTYCQLDGPTFWGLVANVPSGSWVTSLPGAPPGLRGFQIDHAVANDVFAGYIAPVGNHDGVGGDDLVFSNFATGALYLLTGRTWSSGGAPFNVLTTASDLTVVATLGSGAANPIAAPGDVFEDPDAITSGKIDIAVNGDSGGGDTDAFFLQLGETGPDLGDAPFSVIDNIDITAPSTNIGKSFGSAYHSGLGQVLGDIDGDSGQDLLVGTRTNDAFFFWYHDRLAGAVSSGGSTTGGTGYTVPIGASPCVVGDVTCVDVDANTSNLTVQYVGDVNGDGYMDIAVGDWKAETGAGRIVLLF